MNLYEYVGGNPVVDVDPYGLCANTCICVDEPKKCALEYSSGGKQINMGLTKNHPGYGQIFKYSYRVTLKHADGKSTCGCHILQSIEANYTYSNAADAVPAKPTDFGKPAGSITFKSTAKGNVVTVTDSLDYNSSDTVCRNDAGGVDHNGNATLDDTPGPTRLEPDMKRRLDKYTFDAENWVQEVTTIKGNVKMSASFDWTAKVKSAKSVTWSVRSSDGRINEISK